MGQRFSSAFSLTEQKCLSETHLTNPNSLASWAVKRLPVKHNSLARLKKRKTKRLFIIVACFISPFNWFTTVIMIPVFKPFKPQYQHTNSPNWSPYISLKNELREFDNRSRHFLLGDHFIYSHNVSLDSVWILLGENWSW